MGLLVVNNLLGANLVIQNRLLSKSGYVKSFTRTIWDFPSPHEATRGIFSNRMILRSDYEISKVVFLILKIVTKLFVSNLNKTQKVTASKFFIWFKSPVPTRYRKRHFELFSIILIQFQSELWWFVILKKIVFDQIFFQKMEKKNAKKSKKNSNFFIPKHFEF